MVDVTVVIPVYNGEKTIKKCIESVLSQTLGSIEVIVVNDGSTDKTEDIIKSFADPRIKLITTENSGQGYARNRGIDLAEGSYIGFVDADDTVEPDMYEVMHTFAVENGADVVQCAINDITSHGVQSRPCMETEFVKITDIADYTNRYFYTMKHTNEVCNKLFSVEFLKNSGMRFSDTNEVFSEDLKFNIDMLSYIHGIGFINKAFYNYYISDSGHCRNASPERAEKILKLYISATENMTNKLVQRAVRSMGVVNVLLYCVPVIDKAGHIVCSKALKKFMISSCLYKKTLKHTLLMAALILLPCKIKKRLIVRQYTFN